MLRRAFTLVELMVVVAIIAVLAAIVFPVAASAIESAKMTQSASNLRQLAVGVLLYAHDHDEWLPPYTNNEAILAASDPEVTVSTIPTDSRHPRLLKESLKSYLKDDRVWYCPGDQHARRGYGGAYINNVHMSYARRWFPDEADEHVMETGWPAFTNVGNVAPEGLLWTEPLRQTQQVRRSYWNKPYAQGSYVDGHVKKGLIVHFR